MLPTAFGNLPTVDVSGQLDVGDQYVSNSSPAPGQRLLAVGRVDDVVAGLPEGLDDEFTYERVIFDQKNAHEISQPTDLASKSRTSDIRVGSAVNLR